MNFKREIQNKDLLIFDAHCDTVNILLDKTSYFIKNEKSHLDSEKIKKGGLKSQIFAIWVNHVYCPDKTLKKALLLYNAFEKKIIKPGFGIKVTSTNEMQSAIKNGKLACWLSLEGGHIIENSIEVLEFFYSLGIRCMTLTHFKNTDWADSSGDKTKWDGLNKLGMDIIKKMDKIGMAIDVSHSSDKTVEDVLEITTMPIMASHSCARSLCDIPRNLSDDLIIEIAKRDGFIGVNFFPGFLKKEIYDQIMSNFENNKKWFKKEVTGKEDDPDFLNKMELELYSKISECTDKVDLNSVVDHIVHIADIGGIDCVGLGSDFDGISSTPTDLTDVSCYPKLTQKLYDKGFNNNEVRKILGLNLFNFLRNFDK